MTTTEKKLDAIIKKHTDISVKVRKLYKEIKAVRDAMHRYDVDKERAAAKRARLHPVEVTNA